MDYENVLGERKFPTYEQLKTGLLQLIDEGKISREDASRLLPELRESEDEDERTRKFLINFIKLENGANLSPDDAERCIAYLENQKEQKPVEEQFPPLEGLDAIKAKYYDEGFKNGFDEGVDSVKPAEWSEEDQLMRNRCIADLGYLTEYEPQYKERYDEQIEWLKSLLQPNPEVTDEEIEEMVTRRSRSTGTTKSEMDFYRNGIKDAIKRFGLSPSWKPTEEQMNYLCAAVDAAIRKHNESVSGYKPARVLKSLYEQLKKL